MRFIPELSVLYNLTDAIVDGLREGGDYRDEDGNRQTLDHDTWREWAPLDIQLREVAPPGVAVYM